MSLIELLETVELAGAELTVDGGLLKGKGLARLTPETKEAIKGNKSGIIKLLNAMAQKRELLELNKAWETELELEAAGYANQQEFDAAVERCSNIAKLATEIWEAIQAENPDLLKGISLLS